MDLAKIFDLNKKQQSALAIVFKGLSFKVILT